VPKITYRQLAEMILGWDNEDQKDADVTVQDGEGEFWAAEVQFYPPEDGELDGLHPYLTLADDSRESLLGEVAAGYDNRECPDCCEPISQFADYEESCPNCGHVWNRPAPNDN
jgi:hypothetical protein